MSDSHDDFVRLMLEKSKKKENAEPQSRTGTKEGVNKQEVEDALRAIQDKLQKSKNKF